MPTPTDITAGTITLTNGSAAFTGVGTGWLASDIRQGDIIAWVAGGENFGPPIILSITSNTAGTLIAPWAGPTLTGVAYRIRYQWDSSRVSAQSRQLIDLLGNGTLQSIAGLDGTGGDKGVWLTGAGTAGTFELTAFARSLLDDADAATSRATLGANNAANLNAGTIPDARISSTLGPDKAFRRSNIIGTVSQTAGVPTGALVEQGSNANGSFEKYANGRLVCKSIRGPFDINTPAPSGGQATPYLFWTFPHLFVGNLPCIVCNDSNSSNVQGFAGSGLNGSEFTLRYHTALPNRTAALEATGRWF